MGGSASAETEAGIRAPRPEDAGAIAALLGELGYPASPEEVCTRLAELDRHSDVVVLVATMGELLIGLATAHVIPVVHHDRPVAMLTALVVNESHRRRGVGRRLVETAHGWAREQNAYRITVSSGLARVGAHAFYEGLGYEHTSRRYSRPL